jgi:hypothetical protein
MDLVNCLSKAIIRQLEYRLVVQYPCIRTSSPRNYMFIEFNLLSPVYAQARLDNYCIRLTVPVYTQARLVNYSTKCIVPVVHRLA